MNLTDRIASLCALAKEATAECDTQGRKTAAFLEGHRERLLPPFMLGKPSPEPPKPPPEITGTALAYDQMAKLAALMRGRSPAAYRRARDEVQRTLLAEIKTLADLDEAEAVGMRLYALKGRMSQGLRWPDCLKELALPWGARRADDYIRCFLGRTTALEIKQKAAARARKSRANRQMSHEADR